jgi:hypothetical protein
MFIKSFFFDKEVQVDGDPELLDDSEFYQQLLKEFFETIDPTSSGIFFFLFVAASDLYIHVFCNWDPVYEFL